MIQFDTFMVEASFGQDFGDLLKRQLNSWMNRYSCEREFISFQVIGYRVEEFKILKCDSTEIATVVICYREKDKDEKEP